MTPRTLLTVAALLFLIAPISSSFTPAAFGNEQADKIKSIFDHLRRAEPLEITIRTDLGELINNRRRDTYQDAQFLYEDISGVEASSAIEIKPRGKFRRRVCDFPPLKLKFPKKELLAAGFSEHNDLKLVTHCIDDKTIGQDYLLREYLVYQLYNELTDNSFRVQLVKVTYEDNGPANLGKIKRYGFLLEDEDEISARLGGEQCECRGLSQDSLIANEERLMSMFQFMIGNTDWDMAMSRNLLQVRRTDNYVLPVGYDFDFSGLVNASYALPNSDHKLMTVRDRIYLGFPASNAELKQTIEIFKAKKDNITRIVSGFKLLDKTSRDDVQLYINSFYSLIDQLEQQPGADWYTLLNQPIGGPTFPQPAALRPASVER